MMSSSVKFMIGSDILPYSDLAYVCKIITPDLGHWLDGSTSTLLSTSGLHPVATTVETEPAGMIVGELRDLARRVLDLEVGIGVGAGVGNIGNSFKD